MRRLSAAPFHRGARFQGELPGDDLVPGATVVATHGIDIAAPPQDVWPWVAQLGQERAGTYAWAENLVGCRITNADRIHPEWQNPQPGDVFRLHPDMGLRVAEIDTGTALVVTGFGAVDAHGNTLPDTGFDFSWSFTVLPGPSGGSRLLTRERYLARTMRARAMVGLRL